MLVLSVVPIALSQVTCTPSLPDPLVGAEDARPTDGPLLQVLLDAARSDEEDQRRRGFRALGRLERPELLSVIEPGLEDESPAVRRVAADAVGQAMQRASDGRAAAEILHLRLGKEGEAHVIAAIAETIGRLGFRDKEAADWAGDVIGVVVASFDGQPEQEVAWLGAALGFEALARRNARSMTLAPRHAAILHRLAGFEADSGGLASARIRRLATSALGSLGALEGGALDRALADPDAGVRRVALAFVGGAEPAVALRRISARALADPDERVRFAGVRLLAGALDTGATCTQVLDAVTDPSVQVRLAALEAIDPGCSEVEGAVEQLAAIAGDLPSSGQDWHDATYATVALTRIAEAGRLQSDGLRDATEGVADLAAHENPFVRAHAARALANLGDADGLTALADDDVPNVRTAALQALADMGAQLADSLLLAQLAFDDPQLLLTTAGLLAERESSEALFLGAALATLERISTSERETWRDARSALLGFIGGAATGANADEVRPYLGDFDPQVATQAAEILTRLTGEVVHPTPRLLPPEAIPTTDDLAMLALTEVVLGMVRGGEIRIALDPDLAPTNAARFARLASEGILDGRTLHRVVPNFVVQGGSAGANEYLGEDRFTRDELGLQPHWRGTVGLSTRGRDTGDGQLFFNLIDNVRLNHDFTIFGTVVSGMNVVDQIREGDVIRSARTELRTVNSGG